MILSTIFALFYTDPGTGTLILQLLAAAFLGLVFYFRYFTKRVKNYFSRDKTDAGSEYASTAESRAQHPTAPSDLSEKIE